MPTRTTNEYNYWWRSNTEKGKEYRKRTNQNHYLRHSNKPVSRWDMLEEKKELLRISIKKSCNQ